MKLDDDWKRVARHAWSVRWILIAAVFNGVDLLFNKLDWLSLPVYVPKWAFVAAGAVAAAMAFVTRFLAQKEFKELTDGQRKG